MSGTLYLVLMFFIKLCDNIIITGKTLLVQKNRAVLASIAVVVSQLLFYLVIDQVISDGSMDTIIIVSIASGIGSYLAFTINSRVSHDKLWVHIVTSNNKTDMKRLGDYMRAIQVPIITFDSYNDDLENTLTALIFANTRQQSSEIDKYLEYGDYQRRIVT